MEIQQPSNETDPDLSHLKTTEDLAEYLRARRISLFANAGVKDVGGLQLAREHSDLVDGVMRQILAVACENAGRGVSANTIPIAVTATGGYGRRELCPYSDIDITFIPHRDGDPVIDRVIKEMFTQVMRIFIDANGVEVGYAYRLLEDCAVLDHQTVSGLLDARLVAGDARLFIQFEHEYWLHFNPAEFIFTKLSERTKQRLKSGTLPRLVEPNLKEGAGGLRDIHTAVWLTQARRSLTAARVRGERAWDVLYREAGVHETDIAELQEAKEFLFRVRNALHAATGAERDHLVVTRQEEIAERLGYSRSPVVTHLISYTEQQRADEHYAPPVELFMRDYYRHASAVSRICDDAMRRIEQGRMFLGIGLDCKRRQIEPANPALFHDDPVWMLWACELAQKYNLEFSDELKRVLLDLLPTNPVIMDTAQAAGVFTRILSSPVGAYPILQRMVDLGILGWLLPPVGDVMDLIPYDPSHDYTVGQHTLHVIKVLDGLREPNGDEETREFRVVMQDIPHPEHLYLAALLHDVGKVTDEKPHADTGADLAIAICRWLGWDVNAGETVAFLVRHHLLMAETSRLRDLNLDETIRDFTATVNDLDHLHMLFLLTYADTKAVGEGVWTHVKGRFLKDLLRRTERAIAGDEPEEYDDAMLARTRRRLLKELSVENLPPDEVIAHVESMPATYILNTTLSEMALHIGYVRRARQGEPTIDFHDERNATYTEVTVCTPDDPEPGLLAKITGVFYAADLNVHSAQVFTRVAGNERIAIDSFYADFRGRQLTSGKRKELATAMTAVLTGKSTVAEILAKRRKHPEIGGLMNRINARNDLAESYTVIEVAAPDENSMLYRVSGALSSLRWDIHSARVSLFRGRSVASFYVTMPQPLTEADARRALNRLMPCSPQ